MNKLASISPLYIFFIIVGFNLFLLPLNETKVVKIEGKITPKNAHYVEKKQQNSRAGNPTYSFTTEVDLVLTSPDGKETTIGSVPLSEIYDHLEEGGTRTFREGSCPSLEFNGEIQLTSGKLNSLKDFEKKASWKGCGETKCRHPFVEKCDMG